MDAAIDWWAGAARADEAAIFVRISPYRSSAMLGSVSSRPPLEKPEQLLHGAPPRTIEAFESRSSTVWREVFRRSGETVVTALTAESGSRPDGRLDPAAADAAWLRTHAFSHRHQAAGVVGVVDLFSGCGGLSYGLVEAIRAVGAGAACIGIDNDPVAISTYQRNLPCRRALVASMGEVFGSQTGGRVTPSERALMNLAGETTFLLGGPPCQGHSAFNNRTRHSDERNALYLTMVRAAEVLQPAHVIIENVPGALRDRAAVVQRSVDALERLGYTVEHCVVDMSLIGVPQLRKRLVMVGSLTATPRLAKSLAVHKKPVRNLRWAIGDLEDEGGRGLLDEPCASAPQTRRRIDALFEEGLWDLPNSYRPKCHAHGRHSYRSIYGRLRWDQPAQTITTGFYSMCMGRNVHPSRRRTLTAHEAARIQFMPDAFDFSTVSRRTDLARLIGNAVPPRLGYVLGLELLR